MTYLADAEARPIARFNLGSAAIVLLACAAVAIAYGLTQDRIAYGGGYPYDASTYMQVAQQVSLGQDIAAEKPFVYRIGLPYLVGILFPDRLLIGFLVLNVVFGAATLGVLYAFLRYFTTNGVVILLSLLLFTANPQGPFRFTYFYPALTDTPALLAMLSIFYLNVRWQKECLARAAVMSALSLAGVLFREIVLLAPLSLAVAACLSRVTSNARDKDINWRHSMALAAGPVAAGLFGVYLTHAWVQPTGEYTFVGHALTILSVNLHSPMIYPLSVLTAYGPLALLLIIQWSVVFVALRKRVELAAFLGLTLAIATMGGYHTDRFMYWLFPAVIPLQALVIERLFMLRFSIYTGALVVSLVAAQLLAFRAFGGLPNAGFDALSYPGHPSWIIFAPYGDGSNFGQIYAAYMGFRSRAILAAEYLALTAWFLFLWRHITASASTFGRRQAAA